MLAVAAPLAAAKPGNGNGNGRHEAAKLCAEQKKADKAAFKALWGKHAMRDCIRAGRAEDQVAMRRRRRSTTRRRSAAPSATSTRPGSRDLRHQRQRPQRLRQVRVDQGPRRRAATQPHDLGIRQALTLSLVAAALAGAPAGAAAATSDLAVDATDSADPVNEGHRVQLPAHGLERGP